MLTKEELNIIENTLANAFDWNSSNLEDDFVEFINSEIPNLKRDDLFLLIKKFTSINPIQRDSINFDLQSFVQKYIS